MRRNATRAFFIVLLAASLAACGLIYTDIQYPRAYRSATPADVKASASDPVVSGEACSQSLVFLFAWGDGGYAAATRRALEGRPEAILYDVQADVKARAYLLGLYTQWCTVVTGKVGRF
jgi:predicted small lipoprotein YifL